MLWRPSINDVGNFSRFLTPPSPVSAVFYYILSVGNLDQFLTPPLLPIADVVYGRPLAKFWYEKVASNQPSFNSQALKSK